ncbi:biotin synthase [Peptococcaceae bacterium CEB3]|nr:biotin synthase [Peptococcaceae bacterium CEB3]
MRWGEKRYNNFNGHLRQVFGEKVFKVPLDAGFTCPNRDGTLGSGGCVYCSARGSGDFAGEQGKSISAQFAQVKEQMRKKWPKGKYLAYFQAYTNTYAPVVRLREVFEEALAQEGVVGLAIATRPDCLPNDVLDYLQELHERTYLWVELGLQTIHGRSLAWMRRGHDYSAFLEGLGKLRQRGVRVCAHLILGLPGEGRQDIMATAEAVARLPLQAIKLHLLHVLKGTPLAEIYEREPFPLLTKEEYVTYVADILEILPPETIIQRLTGDGPPNDLIAPFWSLRKWEILNAIDKELSERDSWQGHRSTQADGEMP